MIHAPKPRRTPIALAVLAALQAATAHAQAPQPAPKAQPAQAESSEASQLPRISVSGDGEEQTSIKTDRVESAKFTQPLLDTPQTVTVIRSEVILQQGAASLSDTLRNVPGITFQLGENGNTQSGDTIFMRGFDTQNSIFLDGIRDLGAAVRDVFNIEQVEIFKGPAGADNGRGATSGYVNLASKLPTTLDQTSGTLAYGTEDRRRLTADWNQSIGDNAAFRLNLLGQDGGVAGRDYIERQSWGVAPSLALGLGTETRFYAFGQHVRQDNTPDGTVPAIGVADWANPILDPAGIDAPRVDHDKYYGLRSDYEDIEVDMLTLRFEHDFSDNATIRNTARYGRSEQERVLTAPLQAPIVSDTVGTVTTIRNDPNTWTLNRTRHASFRENEILTNQTNITTKFKTGAIEHSLATGVELIYEKQFNPTVAGLGTLAPTSLYNPDIDGVFTLQPAIAKTGAFTDGNTLTTAAYAFDTWKLNPQWELTTGVRFEHFNTESESVAISTATPPVTTAARLSDSDNLISWKVAALFKPTPESSVYAAFANSLKPPGADSFQLNATGTNINSPNLDPQKATNIEVGAKWDLLDGKLAATGAVFKSVNKNDLARTDPADPDSVVQYGEREVKGIELGLVGQVTDKWQITAGLTRQDTEVTQGSLPAAGGPSTQTGSNINFSPKLSVTTWTTYKILPNVTVGGGARHISTSSRTVTNVPVTAGIYQVPSFTVVDLYAAWQVTNQLGVQLNAYNVTDEDYIASINNSGQRYNAGVPLSYLATVNFKF
jgi:catecholate siderophore receptor